MDNALLITTERFADWAKLKLAIHLSENPRALYFKKRQIWWASLGQNIGNEQNGKHKNFERPILILKKFNGDMFLAVPLSSQIKPGDYRVIFKRNNKSFTANISQIRVLSSKRLLRQIGKIDVEDFNNIQKLFQKLL